MKKIRQLLTIGVFALAIVGAIAAKRAGTPADLWSKDPATGECLRMCSSFSGFPCYDWGYLSEADCILERPPQIVAFRPEY